MATNHDLFVITKGPADDTLHVNHVVSDEAGVPQELHKEVPLDYPGRRKVAHLARQNAPGEASRGPGFSILPNRPDPGSAQMSCYLVNQRNLRDVNPWTVAEWSQSDQDDAGTESPQAEAAAAQLDPAAAPEFHTTDFEALLAGPGGKVYFVAVAGDSATVDALSDNSVALESELWSQLRNGMVAGTVRYQGHDGGPKTVAAVNVTAVLPRKGA